MTGGRSPTNALRTVDSNSSTTILGLRSNQAEFELQMPFWRSKRKHQQGQGDMSSSTTSAARPSVRLVSESAHGSENVQDDMEGFDGDDIAPALALMDMSERADSPDRIGDAPAAEAEPDHRVQSSSRNKSLPETPRDSAIDQSRGTDQPIRSEKAVDAETAHQSTSSRNDLARELGVANVVDLNDREDTMYHRHQAPAVVHETIEQPVHEILHEVYERDIHMDEIYHRILPVQDVEVLPSRHFVEDAHGRRREVPASQIPGRSREALDQALAKCLQASLPPENTGSGKRQFTARDFSGTAEDYKESVDSAGTKRTEQWWVHSPNLEQRGAENEDALWVHFHWPDDPKGMAPGQP